MPSNESELPRVYCVARNHPEVEAENVCTNVMKYAGCGSMVDGEWHSSSLRCNAHSTGCLNAHRTQANWHFMISYTQRNPTSETLAHALESELKSRGKTVWLDVKMDRRDKSAMKEGVENSHCVIAIVSDAQEGQEDAAYFQRKFCLNELRWAVAAQVFIQPIVAAEDKSKISELVDAIPADLQHLQGVNWEHIDRKDVDYFALGVTKIIRASEECRRLP